MHNFLRETSDFYYTQHLNNNKISILYIQRPKFRCSIVKPAVYSGLKERAESITTYTSAPILIYIYPYTVARDAGGRNRTRGERRALSLSLAQRRRRRSERQTDDDAGSLCPHRPRIPAAGGSLFLSLFDCAHRLSLRGKVCWNPQGPHRAFLTIGGGRVFRRSSLSKNIFHLEIWESLVFVFDERERRRC